MPPGGGQVRFGRFCQAFPGENHIVAVHDQTFLFWYADGHFRCGRGFGGSVLSAADGAKLPLHDLLQLPVVNGRQNAHLGLFLFQAAFQVHEFLYPVPFHRMPRPVAAKYGVRGVFQVRLRVVGRCLNHLPGIVAGLIAPQGQAQPAQTLGVGGELGGIVPDFSGGDPALQNGHPLPALRGLGGAAHGPDVRNGPADLGLGQLQVKIIPGL